MKKYRVERDEIYNAKQEIKELNRLMNEAKERLYKSYDKIRDRTWGEWIMEWFGYY